ncbi:hypothetical protein H4R19_005884 [Coemansia spiralis]|nr:hypothetical protein H4R19_005884 [Coemansia spiralis]
MANLALLKMYQFNPTMLDLDVVRRVLAKALISPSQGDFNLCLYLLSDEICKDGSVAKLLVLREYLVRAEFDKFWNEMYGGDDDDESVVDGIAGFDSGLRKLILGEVTSTYQTIQAKLVGKMVNLDEEAVLRLAKEHGWGVDEAGMVSLPLKAENEAKASVINENVKFEHLTKLLCAASDV